MDDARRERIRPWKHSAFVLACAAVAILAAACSKSDSNSDQSKADAAKSGQPQHATTGQPASETEAAKPPSAEGALDTSKLPRVSGGKQILGSAATTIYTSPDPVEQTANAVDKALAAAGWQKYVAPGTAVGNAPDQRMMSLKKGTQALSVFITIAPAQNNATSVQYAALPVKTDLPFVPGATNIEYAPERALLSLITTRPLGTTLDFYRHELGARGWSLWSDKLGAKQGDAGPAGIVHSRGAYAHYVNDKNPDVMLRLTAQPADAGKTRIDIREMTIAVLQDGIAMAPAPQVDVRTLPRLAGAQDNPDRSPSSSRISSVIGVPLVNAVEMTVKSLAAGGWTEYRRPDDESGRTLKFFKKGPQGVTASFFTPKPAESIIELSPAWIYVDLPFPEAATDVVFDENRPYLKATASGQADAVLDFYQRELGAEGWVPLSAARAKANWPNANLDGKSYFIRDKQKPIVVSLNPRESGKVDVEVKVAPFALPQSLAAGTVYSGLPTPKPAKTAGGTGGDARHEAHALVMADIDAVLAFYRHALPALGWKEDDGAVVKPDEATLKFTTPQGPAVLSLGRKYDLVTVNLVQDIAKPAAKPEPPAPRHSPSAANALDDAMKQMQQMMKDAGVSAAPRPPEAPSAPAGAQAQAQPLRAQADGKTPVPVPSNARDVAFDGKDGRLEFTAAPPPAAVADFYRAAMKAQGWESRPSVINNANMVVLNFARAGKAVSFTIMRMGASTNVSAQGSGLKAALAHSADAHPAASTDDLTAEDSEGLPLPKCHTMSVGTKTPFRRELKATVPLNFGDVLGFYRRELGKLNWKEQSGAPPTATSAAIRYASPDGPAVLKLERKDDAIEVDLMVKNPDAAAKAGVLPKPGRALVLLGNINGAAQTVMFDNKAYKVEPGAGTKAPNGPRIDLSPGKHKYSVAVPGRPTQAEELDIGEGDTWGLMVGPGGILPLQTY